MRIAEVSERYGLTADTLRYYERIGLLAPIARNKSGVRDYSDADCSRIEFIRCMRSCNIPIETLTEYMGLLDQGESTLEQRKQLLLEQRESLEEQIQTLQQGLERLDAKIALYDYDGEIAEPESGSEA